MKTQLLQRLMIVGLATTLTTGAWAQQDSQQKQSDGDSKKPAAEQQARGDAQADSKKSKRQRDQSDQRSQKDRQQQRQQTQRQRSDRQRSDWGVEPAGWIRVASDTDNDGFFDTVETIYVYDLEQARKNSRMRANRDAQRLTRSSRADRSQQRASDSQRTATVRGTIENLHKDTIAGLDGKFIFSRIKTQNGRVARVLLGPDS